MRGLLAVVSALFLALPLIGADGSSLIVKPAVVVFPFTANGSTINREASAQLATIIATQMSASGRVTVIAPPPGTERKDFLSVARAQNADYYIAGFMSPLGTGVSVVEQVVSTTSGIVVYSNTSQLTSYADAAGQGEDLAVLVSRHANRGLASIGTPPPAAAGSAAPTAQAQAQANLGRLFSRKKKVASAAPSATPSPVPTSPALLVATPRPTPAPVMNVPSPPAVMLPAPSPVPAAPVPAAAPVPKATASGTPLVVTATAVQAPLAAIPVSGSADLALREAAEARLASSLKAQRFASSAAACSSAPRDAVLSGILSVKGDVSYGGAGATFELIARDCAGKVLWSRGFTSEAVSAQTPQAALERVVDAAVEAYLNARKTTKS